jgi:hypothetical protein
MNAPFSPEVTTHTAPADALIFEFPASMRAVLLGGAVFFTGFTALGAAMQLTRPSRGSWVLVLLLFLVFVPAAIYCTGAYRRFRDRVAVNAEGIWYLPKNGLFTFIAWSDIAEVKANDAMQRLIVTDASGSRTIRAEYQLGNFATLREFVLAHTKAPARNPVGQSMFHRSWINKIILLGFGFLMLAPAMAAYRQSAGSGFYLFVGLGACCFLLVVLDPLTLEVTQENVVIRYPAWTRTIPFSSIAGIKLDDVRDPRNGNVWAAVVIERRKGRRIRLFRLREGSIALNDALQRAWSAKTRT